jgi:hypothetical protein
VRADAGAQTVSEVTAHPMRDALDSNMSYLEFTDALCHIAFRVFSRYPYDSVQSTPENKVRACDGPGCPVACLILCNPLSRRWRRFCSVWTWPAAWRPCASCTATRSLCSTGARPACCSATSVQPPRAAPALPRCPTTSEVGAGVGVGEEGGA